MCDNEQEREEYVAASHEAWINAEVDSLTPYYLEPDGPWTMAADLRGAFGDHDSNHPVQRLIRDRLTTTLPGLAERIEFDSEMSCFFAHAQTEEDGQDLVAFIIGLVAQGAQA